MRPILFGNLWIANFTKTVHFLAKSKDDNGIHLSIDTIAHVPPITGIHFECKFLDVREPIDIMSIRFPVGRRTFPMFHILEVDPNTEPDYDYRNNDPKCAFLYHNDRVVFHLPGQIDIGGPQRLKRSRSAPGQFIGFNQVESLFRERSKVSLLKLTNLRSTRIKFNLKDRISGLKIKLNWIRSWFSTFNLRMRI